MKVEERKERGVKVRNWKTGQYSGSVGKLVTNTYNQSWLPRTQDPERGRRETGSCKLSLTCSVATPCVPWHMHTQKEWKRGTDRWGERGGRRNGGREGTGEREGERSHFERTQKWKKLWSKTMLYKTSNPIRESWNSHFTKQHLI